MIADPARVMDLVIERLELRPMRPARPDPRYASVAWPNCSCAAPPSPCLAPINRREVLAEVGRHAADCGRGSTMAAAVDLWDSHDEDCGRDE